MSVQAITWALGFQVENATEKAVLLVLANYADGDGAGKVRGLLCHPCNIALPHVENDAYRTAALAYLKERG